jgi:CMP-N-acetylneuraminic acid synthetase
MKFINRKEENGIMSDVAFFLPTRKGSQRIKNKNTRPFSCIEGGLVEIKLNQLLSVNKIDKIILSTNDEGTIKVAKKLDPNLKKIKIDVRPEALCSSTTRVEDLINYIPTVVKAEHIFWAHATAPFTEKEDYEKAIDKYFNILEAGYDSLMSVTKLQQFLWSETKNEMINYNRKVNKWPNTQDLEPLYEINHAFYISSRNNYLNFSDRIGEKPFLYELDRIKSFDIDWEDDFIIAEAIYDKFFNKNNEGNKLK